MECDVTQCKAACCGLVPIPKDIFGMYRHLITRKVILVEDPMPTIYSDKAAGIDAFKVDYSIKGAIIVVDEEGRCGFLDADFRCMIYNYRPDICRWFGSRTDHFLLLCPHKDLKGSLHETKEAMGNASNINMKV